MAYTVIQKKRLDIRAKCDMSPMAKKLVNSKLSQGKAAMFNNNMSGNFFP